MASWWNLSMNSLLIHSYRQLNRNSQFLMLRLIPPSSHTSSIEGCWIGLFWGPYSISCFHVAVWLDGAVNHVFSLKDIEAEARLKPMFSFLKISIHFQNAAISKKWSEQYMNRSTWPSMVLLFFSKICSVPITINHTIHAAGIFTYAKKTTIQINKFMGRQVYQSHGWYG